MGVDAAREIVGKWSGGTPIVTKMALIRSRVLIFQHYIGQLSMFKILFE